MVPSVEVACIPNVPEVFNEEDSLRRYLKLAPGSGVSFTRIVKVCEGSQQSQVYPRAWPHLCSNYGGINMDFVKKPLAGSDSGLGWMGLLAPWVTHYFVWTAFPRLVVESYLLIAANPVMHEKTKHFDIDVHLVREKVASGLIKTEKVDSKSQVADILTKALGTAQHTVLSKKIGLVNMFVS
ncbi:hypothetical protein Tco_1531134 [Tanacetum coccineum]